MHSFFFVTGKDSLFGTLLAEVHSAGGSNYLPALEKFHRLPNMGYHDQLALSVCFFSDGTSTDHMKLGISVEESYKLMKDAIASIASSFGDALTISDFKHGWTWRCE